MFAAAADSAQLEADLARLVDSAKQCLGGGEPGSPSVGGPLVRRGSSRALLPCPLLAAPDRFAAGRQWPPSTTPADARAAAVGLPPPLWDGSALSCPAELFDQVYSAWLWGPGEAGPESQVSSPHLTIIQTLPDRPNPHPRRTRSPHTILIILTSS